MALTPNAGLTAAASAVLVPGTTYYISLHSASTGTTGANEFSGGGYARASATFTAGTAQVANTASVTIANAGTTAATYAGVWSAATAGTYLGGLKLNSSATGTSIAFNAGALVYAVSDPTT